MEKVGGWVVLEFVLCLLHTLKGEEGVGVKGVCGTLVSLCEFAPGPLHSRYHIWDATNACNSV